MVLTNFFAGIGPQLAVEIDHSGRSYKSYLNNCDSLFRFSLVTETTILNVIKKLKQKTSSCVVCVSNKLLKQIAPIIISPVHYLINLSLETLFVPQKRNVLRIIPIYKTGSGDKSNYSNFRPILILSSFAKEEEQSQGYNRRTMCSFTKFS